MLDPNATLKLFDKHDHYINVLRTTNATLMHQNAQLTEENETYKRKSAAYDHALDRSLAQCETIYSLHKQVFLQSGRIKHVERENAACMALMTKVVEASKTHSYLVDLEKDLIQQMRARIEAAKFIEQNNPINTKAITECTAQIEAAIAHLQEQARELQAASLITKDHQDAEDLNRIAGYNSLAAQALRELLNQTNNAPGTNAGAKTKETDPMHEPDAQTIGAPETEQPKEDTPLQQEQYRNVLGSGVQAFPPPIPNLTQQIADIKAAITANFGEKRIEVKYDIHHYQTSAAFTIH